MGLPLLDSSPAENSRPSLLQVASALSSGLESLRFPAEPLPSNRRHRAHVTREQRRVLKWLKSESPAQCRLPPSALSAQAISQRDERRVTKDSRTPRPIGLPRLFEDNALTRRPTVLMAQTDRPVASRPVFYGRRDRKRLRAPGLPLPAETTRLNVSPSCSLHSLDLSPEAQRNCLEDHFRRVLGHPGTSGSSFAYSNPVQYMLDNDLLGVRKLHGIGRWLREVAEVDDKEPRFDADQNWFFFSQPIEVDLE